MKTYLNEYHDELSALKVRIERTKFWVNVVSNPIWKMINIVIKPILLSLSIDISKVELEDEYISLNLKYNCLSEEALTRAKECPLLTPLSYASVKGDILVLTKLVNSKNVNDNDEFGNAPLYYAAKHQRFEAVKFFLNLGANQENLIDLLFPMKDELEFFIEELKQHNIKIKSLILTEVTKLPYEICLYICQFEGGTGARMESPYYDEFELLGDNSE